MDPSQAFTFPFSPDVTGSQANFSYIFFTIFDETANQQVVSDGFLAANTTNVTVNAGTLVTGHQYNFELDYSNRDISSVSDFGASQFPAQVVFDVRTMASSPRAQGPPRNPQTAPWCLPPSGFSRRKIRRARV